MASVLEVWGFSVQDHSVCELISLAGYGRLSLPSQCPYSTVGGGDSRAFRDHGRPCLTQTVRWGLTPEFVCDICMILQCTCAFPSPMTCPLSRGNGKRVWWCSGKPGQGCFYRDRGSPRAAFPAEAPALTCDAPWGPVLHGLKAWGLCLPLGMGWSCLPLKELCV